MTADIILLDGATKPELLTAEVAGGSLVAYTAPAPDKTTDNEDSVAAITYGPGAVVLVVADGAGGLPAEELGVVAIDTRDRDEVSLLAGELLGGRPGRDQRVEAGRGAAGDRDGERREEDQHPG